MDFLKNNIATIIGVALGAVAGYLYYHFVGCNGSCLISSNPYRSILYGALMGGLAVNAFQKKKVKEDIS
jgi:uncharacterized protein YcfJ